MSIDRWMDKEVMVYFYNAILLNHKKELILVICIELDESRVSYIEWSKLEKQVSYIHTHTYGIKKNSADEPSRKWTCGYSGRRWGWDRLRK